VFQEVVYCKMCLSLVSQELKDNYLQNKWIGAISNLSRGLLYNHIACFQVQPYLDILTLDTFRISSTKINVSTQRLFTETGRLN